jgi:hypothetical protein
MEKAITIIGNHKALNTVVRIEDDHLVYIQGASGATWHDPFEYAWYVVAPEFRAAFLHLVYQIYVDYRMGSTG